MKKNPSLPPLKICESVTLTKYFFYLALGLGLCLGLALIFNENNLNHFILPHNLSGIVNHVMLFWDDASCI
jgi:hypothetical protein